MQQQSSVWPFQLDGVENWAYTNNVFSKQECEEIIRLGNELTLTSGGIEKSELHGDLNIRNSKVAFFNPSPETHWIFSRLADHVFNLNSQYFNFELHGMFEGLQFTKYEAPDGHYVSHIDKCLNTIVRKISVTVQLSDPSEYVGGELNLFYGYKPVAGPKEQGTMIAFPSYALHQVMPVTEGTRYSLVCWVSGPSFR